VPPPIQQRWPNACTAAPMLSAQRGELSGISIAS
jgi:hypothetical protein